MGAGDVSIEDLEMRIRDWKREKLCQWCTELEIGESVEEVGFGGAGREFGGEGSLRCGGLGEGLWTSRWAVQYLNYSD